MRVEYSARIAGTLARLQELHRGGARTSAESRTFPFPAGHRPSAPRYGGHIPMTEATTRLEHDLLGDRAVPVDAYYGVHTLRAVENFPITGTPISIYPDLIGALACVKQAAALRQPRARPARRGARPTRSSRPARRSARQAARPVRRRRDPGRRRHLDQHERQRGDRQPRARAARPRAGRVPVPASERARQPEPEHQRRLSDGAQGRAATSASAGSSTRWRRCATRSKRRPRNSATC